MMVAFRYLFLVITALSSAGLAVGLSDRASTSGQDHFPTTPVRRNVCSPRPQGLWQPLVGVTWNYQLLHPVTSPSTVGSKFHVWDVDLFDNTAATIQTLKRRGHKVICYFSAGSYEGWRPDASSFSSADLGDDLDGWPGERWLDIRSQRVRNIMKTRLDLAVTKGCDGVDPDNVDGYDNDNGLGLTEADSVDYVTFLANQAHSRNLSVGLKNAGGIVDDVIDCVEWSVNEQCVQYDECDTYSAFIQHQKPVFHVEYPKGDTVSNDKPVAEKTRKKFCGGSKSAQGFSTILKNIDLDVWIETC